jgi:hypothetical protein
MHQINPINMTAVQNIQCARRRTRIQLCSSSGCLCLNVAISISPFVFLLETHFCVKGFGDAPTPPLMPSTTCRSLYQMIAFCAYATIWSNQKRHLDKTTSVASTRIPRTIIAQMKFAKVGLKGRTPVVLKRFAARTRGKKNWTWKSIS